MEYLFCMSVLIAIGYCAGGILLFAGAYKMGHPVGDSFLLSLVWPVALVMGVMFADKPEK